MGKAPASGSSKEGLNVIRTEENDWIEEGKGGAWCARALPQKGEGPFVFLSLRLSAVVFLGGTGGPLVGRAQIERV